MSAITDLLSVAAARYGIPLDLLTAVARTESALNPAAQSSKGAMGVMQLMPATAIQYGVSDPWDAAQNIDGGAHLLSDLLRRYNGDTSLALAAYNAGPGNVSKYGGIPPFPETQSYVSRILAAIGGSSTSSEIPAGNVDSASDTGWGETEGITAGLSTGAILALAGVFLVGVFVVTD